MTAVSESALQVRDSSVSSGKIRNSSGLSKNCNPVTVDRIKQWTPDGLILPLYLRIKNEYFPRGSVNFNSMYILIN